jgi:hypothetical protein
MSKQIISEEFKRMQRLAGLITESQLNEASQNLKVSFGPFKNVEYYKIGNDKIYLIVTNSDNFGEIENSIDFGNRDYMTDKEISFLNGEVEDLADKMSEYLTSIGIENEVYDNPIGYGQEIDNLVVSINPNDLSKLK